MNQTLEALSIYVLKLIERYAPMVLLSLLVLWIGFWLASFARRQIAKLLVRVTKDETLSAFLARVVHVVIIVLTIITALSQLGIQTTSIIAVLGTAGLAIALSLKDSLSNLASGLMLIVFRLFKKGDSIEVGSTLGTVFDIGLFHTTITTIDNRSVVIPNSKITTDRIVNYTAFPTRQLEWSFGVAYESNLQKAKVAIEQTLKSEPRILQDQPFFIGVNSLGNSSVDFMVRAWVNKEDYLAVRTAINEAMKCAFDEVGVEIPYNKLDVIHINKS